MLEPTLLEWKILYDTHKAEQKLSSEAKEFVEAADHQKRAKEIYSFLRTQK